MFENILNFLDELDGEFTYTAEVETDNEGYTDRECPREECMSKFKILEEDWVEKCSDEAIYCPYCGYDAPSNSWWTTEQVEQAQEQALGHLKASINAAIEKDVRKFNRHTPKKGFITLSMKFSGSTYFPEIPITALEEMEQKITCENCGVHYAVIGSAFYCPCCGHNSAKQTFSNTIEKVNAKIKNLDTIREVISNYSKDEAERTCLSLIESSIPDLVVAFQRLCECVYPMMQGAKPVKKNVFQRLNEGSILWKDVCGKGYEDWVENADYQLLKKCFQQRHILQHKDGIVDTEYIIKSGDNSYKEGQRLIIKESDVLTYSRIVSNLGEEILNLIKSHQA